MNNIKQEQQSRFGFLFDLDGVLIDSEREYSEIWKKINDEFPTGVEKLEIVIKGCTLEKILNDYFPDPVIREKVTSRLYELESKMKYYFLPGAEELLRSLRKNGFPVALVTSSNSDKMAHLYDEIPHIKNYFDIIITADKIRMSKPNPEGYLLAASSLGVPANNCAVFEDSLQGVKAGRNAGCYVVGVAGTLPPEKLSTSADVIIDSLTQIDVVQLSNKLMTR